MKTTTTLLTLALSIASYMQLKAQEYVLAVNNASNNKTIYMLDGTNGSILSTNLIDLNSLSAGTIKDIVQVDFNLWISDQTADRIYIFDVDGTYLSSITTGLDNIRGLDVVNNEVWVSNAGSGNGATPNSIVRYTKTGTFIGYTSVTNTSIFDVLDNGNNQVYVAGLTNQGIQILNYNGVEQGNLVPSGVFQNMQQINFDEDGNLLVAVFQNNAASGNTAGVYQVSTTDGSILNRWSSTLLRGVVGLGDGNILFTNESGINKINTANNTLSLVQAGNFHYLSRAPLSNLSIKPTTKPSTTLFPNPAVHTIQLDSPYAIQSLEVYTIEGKLVLSQQPNTNQYQLAVEQLPKGTYIISLHGNGNTTKHKFVKE